MKFLSMLMLVGLLGTSFARAETVFVNGSFETGDYQGWTLSESPSYWEDPTTFDLWDLRGYGTWGICQNDEVLEYNGKLKHDYADSTENLLLSPSLPKTCLVPDGSELAFQLQDAGQTHLLSQDITLPSNASSVSWSMMYKNHNQQPPFFRGDQRIRVALKNLSGDLIGILFLTDDTMAQEVPSWTTYSADISSFAGTTVRFEVEVSTYWDRLEVFLDDFRVTLNADIPQETTDGGEPGLPVVEEPEVISEDGGDQNVPPGWVKSNQIPKGLEKKEQLPGGFDMGTKTGWK